jgi:hypothetical protein
MVFQILGLDSQEDLQYTPQQQLLFHGHQLLLVYVG